MMMNKISVSDRNVIRRLAALAALEAHPEFAVEAQMLRDNPHQIDEFLRFCKLCGIDVLSLDPEKNCFTEDSNALNKAPDNQIDSNKVPSSGDKIVSMADYKAKKMARLSFSVTDNLGLVRKSATTGAKKGAVELTQEINFGKDRIVILLTGEKQVHTTRIDIHVDSPVNLQAGDVITIEHERKKVRAEVRLESAGSTGGLKGRSYLHLPPKEFTSAEGWLIIY